MKEDPRVLCDKKLSARVKGENAEECSETFDDLRDGDSGSDGEAGEEDGRDGCWGGKEGRTRYENGLLEGHRRL